MIIGYRGLLFVVIGLAFVESVEVDDEKETVNNNCTDVRINKGPLITPCVSEITLQKGQNFTLTCKGTTKLRFRHQDLSEDVADSKFTIKNTSHPIFEEEYSFQRTLDLYNIDQYAIGYYACSDYNVHENIVNNITEEPENNEHVSYIYVYVNGTDSLFAPMSEIIMSRSHKILIECRPSTPDVEVKLSTDIAENVHKRYNPKVGFVLNYDVDSYSRLNTLNMFSCDFATEDRGITKDIFVKRVQDPPVPRIQKAPVWFLPGENFTLNCTANITPTSSVYLRWNFPMDIEKENVRFEENKSAGSITEGVIYNALTIFDAKMKYNGSYSCTSKDSCMPKESNKVFKKYTAKPILTMRIKNKQGNVLNMKYLDLLVEYDAHPEFNVTILKDGKKLPGELKIFKNGRLPKGTEKYSLVFKEYTTDFLVTIRNLTLKDFGDYTLFADNGLLNRTEHFKLHVGADPEVDMGVSHKTCEKGKEVTFRCDVTGFPLPNITWKFYYYNSTDNKEYSYTSNSTSSTSTLPYSRSDLYHIKECHRKGTISCIVTYLSKNLKKTKEFKRNLTVYDIDGGFGILPNTANKEIWVIENSQLSVKCLASVDDFSKVAWEWDTQNSDIVEYQSKTEFSYVAELKIKKTNLNHIGNYTCVAEKNDGNHTKIDDHIKIDVEEIKQPIMIDNINTDEEVIMFDDKQRDCIVIGAPLPEIKWYKDGKPLHNNDYKNVNVSYNKVNRTAATSSISIVKMQKENEGTYECATVGDNSLRKTMILRIKADKYLHYLIPILVIILILLIMIVYLVLNVKKEKKLRKELAKAGLLYFKEGMVNSINPEHGIDEQAELLPYDEKFEFPPEKLVYGKQLGAGAFGIVYKAEARGIINAEETTIVAVKTLKKTVDNMYIKALASELKIMVHLGKHINIVNLLGACTKNVGKRELAVIVEYCMYGNIHNYMQRHREVFIDQLETDNKEKLGRVNRAYTSTTAGSTGVQSDYFGSTNTQDTDNTTLNTGNTVLSARKNMPNTQTTEEVKASESSTQPDWRSNYVSDYSYDDGRTPRPLTSRDLLAWAFQIARGMEYLASRKVLHGDLAARNICLAEDNIVKICDFGLAKSICKNEEYVPKDNCLLPVKWLAIECMTDRIFSTQSDVWSFGVVLWELFSLAKTPYPNMNPPSILPFLLEGHRLNKPAYADDRLYEVMKKCWEGKPTLRPTFSHLQELLGTFLEDNVRRHYVDLNSTFMDKNANVAYQEDYLAMMCAPDYNNFVAPSPCYVNTSNEKNFFPPTPAKVDEEGYLQMSPTNQGIFSPRLPNSEFDFDPRKFNPKTSEASSCGSELTPMLTLNNLPARSGSESDHEGNAPYLNVCPRIDEADEVFAPSINETKNAKNIQHSAVSNPTYITFDNIDEKPLKDINSYVNMNVPNGLVK